MKLPKFEIWDLHCHFSGVEGKTVDERLPKLIEYADRMNVKRLVFFMGWPWSTTPDPDEFRKQNDQVIQGLSHWHDRAFGFAYLNAQYVEESLAEIDRCIANGPLVGIKLWVSRRCGDEELDAIVQRTAELNGIIFQHTWSKVTGNLDGESTPEDLAKLAKRNPDVPIICGHSGGDWERGIRAVRDSPNVSIGIGGFDPTAGIVEMGVRELGAERVIYGSDIGGRSLSSQLAKVYGAQISDAAKERIFGKNLREMMTPILKAKGVTL
ncbi:amidohydrolase family protein [Thalassoglobus sp.]|uniref:amidohydrolase family protein n=1 Tax=Thalassoglobus sp. TaxID=2795869 RepID=UPI003AA7BFA1